MMCSLLLLYLAFARTVSSDSPGLALCMNMYELWGVSLFAKACVRFRKKLVQDDGTNQAA